MSSQRVFDWRRQAREALAAASASSEPAFVPIMAETLAPLAEPAASPARPASSIVVKLAGAMLCITSGTNGDLLTMMLRTIRASAV